MPTASKSHSRGPKPRASAKRAQQHAMIRRIVILDALRGWVVHLVLGGGMLILWILYNIELIGPGPAVTGGGAIVLAGLLFAGLYRFLDPSTTLRTALLLAAFVAGWWIALFPPFDRAVNLPEPLFQEEVRLNAEPLSLAVPDTGVSAYRLIVEGHFRPSTEHVGRMAHYRLALHDGASDRSLEGDFTENWGRQRLGRRGSVAVHRGHTIDQHRLDGPLSPGATLRLESVGPDAEPEVTVGLYPAPLHDGLFAAAGAALTAAALLIDALLAGVEESRGAATTMTLAAVMAVAAFRRFAAPHPGFGDLVVFGGAGVLCGVLVARALWRLVARPLEQLEERFAT